FLDQLLVGDDAQNAVLFHLAETARLENRVQGEIPGNVLQGDRHLALDVVADDHVLVALGGQDTEQVDDVRILEVERDQSLTVGRWRRGRGRRGLCQLHRSWGDDGSRIVWNGRGPHGRGRRRARDRCRNGRRDRGDDDRKAVGLLADRVADRPAEVQHDAGNVLTILTATDLLDRILPDVQRSLAPSVNRVF